VLCTRNSAVHGASSAIGAFHHQPATAQASSAAPAALSDWTAVSRSGPDSVTHLRTERPTAVAS
jgi:hypothetical protein